MNLEDSPKCPEDGLRLFPIVIGARGSDNRYYILSFSYCAYCRKYGDAEKMGTLEEAMLRYLDKEKC